MESPLIEIDDVSVFREQTQILDGIRLQIPRSRHTAVLGPNGSGKSSLLKLLTRDFYPSVEQQSQQSTGRQGSSRQGSSRQGSSRQGSSRQGTSRQGTVRILGETEWEVSRLRRRMGIVAPSLDYEFSTGRTGQMTVGEAVASGFNATRLREFGPQLDRSMITSIDQAIATVKMTALAQRRLDTLSTGERRRVMIARAIVHQPDIFVLDEPTGGLDMTARGEFLEILDSITRRDEMTMVLVTHHLDEIPPQMNHVVLLDSGRVVFDGSKSAGLTGARISNLFRAPVQVSALHNGWYRSELSTSPGEPTVV